MAVGLKAFIMCDGFRHTLEMSACFASIEGYINIKEVVTETDRLAASHKWKRDRTCRYTPSYICPDCWKKIQAKKKQEA